MCPCEGQLTSPESRMGGQGLPVKWDDSYPPPLSRRMNGRWYMKAAQVLACQLMHTNDDCVSLQQGT